MVAPQAKKKEDVVDVINRILDQAISTRRGFTPEAMEQFEQEVLAHLKTVVR